MLIKEAIEMLKRMNPDEEVFVKFKDSITEYPRDNEHLKKDYHMDQRDLHYRGT